MSIKWRKPYGREFGSRRWSGNWRGSELQSLTRNRAVAKGCNCGTLHLLWTTQRDHLPQARACLVNRGPARLLLPTRGTPGVRWKNCTKGIPELFTGLRNIPGRRDRAALTLLLVAFRPLGGILEETINAHADAHWPFDASLDSSGCRLSSGS